MNPSARGEVLEHLRNVKYPSGYAGTLKHKIKEDKKFYGLKTHDCHVLLQNVFPIVIRKYVDEDVADVLVDLGTFFKKLCARELKKSIIRQMREDIVMIMCKLETIFPPAFFTIQAHLPLHIPDQVLRTGPVHFTWMFPIERYIVFHYRAISEICD